jgi:hypothetical protein
MALHLLFRGGMDGLLLHRALDETALARGDDRLLNPDEMLAASGITGRDLLGGITDDRIRVAANLPLAPAHGARDGLDLSDGGILASARLSRSSTLPSAGSRRDPLLRRSRACCSITRTVGA